MYPIFLTCVSPTMDHILCPHPQLALQGGLVYPEAQALLFAEPSPQASREPPGHLPTAAGLRAWYALQTGLLGCVYLSVT